nr:ATP-dependent RNA helicase DEAH11, chloroplastic-like [Ipomoea batatas]
MKDSLQESTSSDPLPKMSSFAPGSYYQQQRRPYPDAGVGEWAQDSVLEVKELIDGELVKNSQKKLTKVYGEDFVGRLGVDKQNDLGVPTWNKLMHISFQNTSLGCGIFHMIGRSSGVVASYVSNVVKIVLDISIGRRSMFRLPMSHHRHLGVEA